jgi:hypothetical protein
MRSVTHFPVLQFFQCGKEQSKYTSGCDKCMYSRKAPVCALCKVEGHSASTCPDNWRRYHSSTSMEHVRFIAGLLW